MLNVLIVEDNSNKRKLYRSYLERAGFLALEAIDGQDALNVLEHNTINLMISTKDCLDDKKTRI
ncbi:MAG TPA: hypothetical protein VFH18_04605 [Erysipelotrichaceae bacterium]|nr:hypothetical protein [Erysipelotrichaceae bacterium]